MKVQCNKSWRSSAGAAVRPGWATTGATAPGQTAYIINNKTGNLRMVRGKGVLLIEEFLGAPGEQPQIVPKVRVALALQAGPLSPTEVTSPLPGGGPAQPPLQGLRQVGMYDGRGHYPPQVALLQGTRAVTHRKT